MAPPVPTMPKATAKNRVLMSTSLVYSTWHRKIALPETYNNFTATSRDFTSMPKVRKMHPAKAGSGQRPPPLVGALLRMTYQVTRERQLKALVERGFADLNQALISVMVYPHPDGVRPGELAERTNMTKQAMNYLLGQLEKLAYIERRAEKGRSRRLVYLTRRGWQAIETLLSAVKEVEAEWAAVLGQKRFDEFLDTLRQLSLIDTKAAGQPSLPRRGRTA